MNKWLVLLPAIFFSPTVFAGPADYVYMPAVQYGEREIDFKYGAASPAGGSSSQGGSIALGYGAQEYWFTEVYLQHERMGNTNVTTAEWDNTFQLTDIGKYPVDMGFITEVEAPLSSNASWELRLGPLLQTELSRFQINGNLIFERIFGATDESGLPYTTNLLYQWQVKYRWRSTLDYGLQGFGEVGKWNQWNPSGKQNHRIGPAVMGKLLLGGRNAICYNAALLYGASTAAPAHTFRLQIEYEF